MINNLTKPLKKKVPKLTPDAPIPQTEIDAISEGNTATNSAINFLTSGRVDLSGNGKKDSSGNNVNTPDAYGNYGVTREVSSQKAKQPAPDIRLDMPRENRDVGVTGFSPSIDFQGDVISDQGRTGFDATPPPLSPYNKAKQDYNNAIASKPQKQGGMSQALWWALQGIQKFTDPKNNDPVQWLGQAKRQTKINDAAQRLAPFQQQEERDLNLKKANTQLQDVEALTRSRNINNALSSNPWIASELEQNIIDPRMSANIRSATGGLVNIPPGDYRGKKFGELNGQVGFFDAKGAFTPSGAVNLPNAVVKVNGAYTTNDRAVQIGAAQDRQQATQDFTLYRDKLKSKLDSMGKQITQQNMNYRAELRSNGSPKQHQKLTELSESQQLYYKRAQTKFNKAQAIAQSWDQNSTEFELKLKPDYKMYEQLMKEAQDDMEKAEDLSPKIKAINP